MHPQRRRGGDRAAPGRLLQPASARHRERLGRWQPCHRLSCRAEIRKTRLTERVVVIPVPDERTSLYTVFSSEAGKRYKRRHEEALASVRREMPYEKFLLQSLAKPPRN